MFKLTSLAVGILSVVMVVPVARSTTFQNYPIQQRINRELYVQKIVPIKKTDRVVPVVDPNIPKKTKPQQDSTNKAEQQKTISLPQLQTTDRPETRNTNVFGPQSDRPVNVGGSLNLLDLNRPRR